MSCVAPGEEGKELIVQSKKIESFRLLAVSYQLINYRIIYSKETDYV